jgi:hypothetical protein
MKQNLRVSNSLTMNQAIADKTAIICRSCGNIYRNIWLKVGNDWNDFGLRYCPFCGMITEDFAHIS